MSFERTHYTKEWMAVARAAIAHLSTRPEGLPGVEELIPLIGKQLDITYDEKFSPYSSRGWEYTRAILTALRPWLRDPVGCELNVHPDQLELYKWVTEPDGGYAYAAQRVLDLCRKRIRPTYECKECAKLRDEVAFWKRENVASNNKMLAARAALEGE